MRTLATLSLSLVGAAGLCGAAGCGRWSRSESTVVRTPPAPAPKPASDDTLLLTAHKVREDETTVRWHWALTGERSATAIQALQKEFRSSSSAGFGPWEYDLRVEAAAPGGNEASVTEELRMEDADGTIQTERGRTMMPHTGPLKGWVRVRLDREKRCQLPLEEVLVTVGDQPVVISAER